MSILEYMREHEEEIVKWRKYMHRNPETSFNEWKTTEYIASLLSGYDIKICRPDNSTGLIGTLARGRGGCIALRADIDALPMQEENTFPHKSKRKGCMHACGHEGHTAMLIAAARYLATTGTFNGTVKFVFQPAEEIFSGAEGMMAMAAFKKPAVDAVFGMHNLPLIPEGKIGISPGCVMAASDFFDITITGKGAHGATPEYGINPFGLFAEFYAGLAAKVKLYNKRKKTIVSVTKLNGGSAYNIIPESISVYGTIRTLDNKLREELLADINKILERTVSAKGGYFSFSLAGKSCPPVINDPTITEMAARNAYKIFGKENVIPVKIPTMGSDDMSIFMKNIPGAYAMLGGGTSKEVINWHNPKYDFNDRVLAPGAALLAAVVEDFLS